MTGINLIRNNNNNKIRLVKYTDKRINNISHNDSCVHSAEHT